MITLPRTDDQLLNYGDKYQPHTCVWGAVSWLYLPVAPIWTDLSLYLHRPEDSTSTEQIEGQLPKKAINAVFDKPGKTGAEGLGIQMA